MADGWGWSPYTMTYTTGIGTAGLRLADLQDAQRHLSEEYIVDIPWDQTKMYQNFWTNLLSKPKVEVPTDFGKWLEKKYNGGA